MLAIIFCFFNLFYTGDSISLTELQNTIPVDSVKRPSKKRPASDTTARFLKVNRIFIVGNRLTRDQIILRELSLKTGDLIYSTDLVNILEVDRKKLINTRLFNTVEINTLELEPGKVDLVIDLKERWYTFPSPIFDLSDRNFNEWWENYNHDFDRVNYGLRLYQFNMRGRNETLKLVAQFGYVKRFELSYRFPYIDKNQKHGLGIDFDYSEAKNMAYQTNDHKLEFIEGKEVLRTVRGAALSYVFRNSFYETHTFKAEYRSNSIRDTIQQLNSNYLGNENTHQEYPAITYQFISDHRDYIGYPLKGYYLNAFATKCGLSDNDDLNKLEASVSQAFYIDLKKDFYLSNNIVGYLSTPDNLPYFNYGALGYKKQFVRGYEVYVIEGPSYVMNKTTLKKKIFSRTYHWKAMPIEQFRHIPFAIYFKIYGDIGYVRNYENYPMGSRLSNKLLSGIGAGFDLVGSYDAVLRFEYTLNAEGQHGFFFNVRREF
ncbi:MAG TPA: POTRA domain-containing protein [Ohtaekwangia sp.]|nr:POTRA domain-containing protein [Ohtaekwangia sp.]